MKGDSYRPADGFNTVSVGSIVIDAAGYTAETDLESDELDACEYLVKEGSAPTESLAAFAPPAEPAVEAEPEEPVE